MAEVLYAFDWSSFTDRMNMDTDAALNCLCDNLTRAIEEFAPLKTLKPKTKKLPCELTDCNKNETLLRDVTRGQETNFS